MNSSENIASILWENTISFNFDKLYDFASGIKSPIYCDNRRLMSDVYKREVIIEEFKNALRRKNEAIDLIAGTATAGIAWAAWLARDLNKPMIYVRGEAKDHGKKKHVEGILKKDRNVILIEDTISTGQSALAAIDNIRQAGGNVSECYAIFTYDFPEGKENFGRAKCNLTTLTDLPTLLHVAVEKKELSGEEENRILAWSKDPGHFYRR